MIAATLAFTLLPWAVVRAGSANQGQATRTTALRDGNNKTREFTDALAEVFERWRQIQYPPQADVQKIRKIRRPFVKQIEAIISNFVFTRLNSSPRPSVKSLQYEVNDAITKAQMKSIYAQLYDENTKRNSHTEFGFVLADDKNPSDFIVTGFAIGWGNVFDFVVHGFRLRQGKFERVAQIGPEYFQNRILQAHALSSPNSREFRFLTFGTMIGSPHGFLQVALFRFDGRRFERLWQREHLSRGEVKFEAENIIIQWLDDRIGKKPILIREIYKQEPKGLRLERLQKEPFR